MPNSGMFVTLLPGEKQRMHEVDSITQFGVQRKTGKFRISKNPVCNYLLI